MIQPNVSISEEFIFFVDDTNTKIRDIAEDNNRIFLSSKIIILIDQACNWQNWLQ